MSCFHFWSEFFHGLYTFFARSLLKNTVRDGQTHAHHKPIRKWTQLLSHFEQTLRWHERVEHRSDILVGRQFLRRLFGDRRVLGSRCHISVADENLNWIRHRKRPKWSWDETSEWATLCVGLMESLQQQRRDWQLLSTSCYILYTKWCCPNAASNSNFGLAGSIHQRPISMHWI